MAGAAASAVAGRLSALTVCLRLAVGSTGASATCGVAATGSWPGTIGAREAATASSVVSTAGASAGLAAGARATGAEAAAKGGKAAATSGKILPLSARTGNAAFAGGWWAEGSGVVSVAGRPVPTARAESAASSGSPGWSTEGSRAEKSIVAPASPPACGASARSKIEAGLAGVREFANMGPPLVVVTPGRYSRCVPVFRWSGRSRFAARSAMSRARSRCESSARRKRRSATAKSARRSSASRRASSACRAAVRPR
jgi:trimeric autotransporter adhesin